MSPISRGNTGLGENSWSGRDMGRKLEAGVIFRLPGTDDLYEVDFVNASRAHAMPLRGKAKIIRPAGQDPKEIESFGGGINISPNSMVERVERTLVDPSTNRLRSEVMEAQTVEGATAEAPRKQFRAALPRKGKATGKAARPSRKGEKMAKAKTGGSVKPCACGCGGETTGFFVQGHDARFKGWLLKIERGEAKKEKLLKPSIIKAYKWVSSGIKGEAGTGERPTTNYKGEPHKGYAKK